MIIFENLIIMIKLIMQYVFTNKYRFIPCSINLAFLKKCKLNVMQLIFLSPEVFKKQIVMKFCKHKVSYLIPSSSNLKKS
jgi:hypothetical protein